MNITDAFKKSILYDIVHVYKINVLQISVVQKMSNQVRAFYLLSSLQLYTIVESANIHYQISMEKPAALCLTLKFCISVSFPKT